MVPRKTERKNQNIRVVAGGQNTQTLNTADHVPEVTFRSQYILSRKYRAKTEVKNYSKEVYASRNICI